uniref:Eukaryotic translation initiation factor 4 gamma 2 n=1 Tax=Sphaeramia orbicularis TaxID=375764 RepID=A0A673CEK3_9TELE
MLGNIKFIGELGKLNLIHESILHKCIKTLLEKKKRVQLKDMGEDLECLCQIMKTVGPKLDHEKARSLMDQYFSRMRSLTNNNELPARIRFLLQNTVELRDNSWVPRKAYFDNGPKTINQVRQDAVKDLGVFIPPPTDAMRNEFFVDNSFLPSRIKYDRETLGGLADMFGQMPGSGIGTGPGVIQDHYSPTMGRHRTNPLFNGHIGNGNSSHQPQFENGNKPYIKQSQVLIIFGNQSAQMQSKDMAPRFTKKGKLNAEEISLRPAQSFILNKKQVPKLQPQMTMIPPSAQGSPLGQSPQLGLKTNPPVIQEKPKSNKKAPPTKEELCKLTETIVTDYLSSKNVNDAVNNVKELKVPKHFLSEMLSKIVVFSLDRSDGDKEDVSTLIHALCTDGLVTGENLLQAFLSVLDQCPKIEEEIPLVKSYLAQFAARAIIADLVNITDLAHQLENGSHFPLFLLCLQQMAKLKDREWLTDLLQQSKINMLKMLPDRMLEILEGKGLSTAVEIKSERCLPHPAKKQLEEEKQQLLSFKPVMQKFLHDHIDLQLGALYALQVHCNAKGFPKGMLLRYFVNFYDMEIIEEEAFLSWKEDITQEYPGKGKALFQVNQWLTWLETAEEEESEDEDY